MKIGIVNFGIFSSGIDQMLEIVLPVLLDEHEVTGIIINDKSSVHLDKFEHKDFLNSLNGLRGILHPSSPEIDNTVIQSFNEFDTVIIIGSGKTSKEISRYKEYTHSKLLYVPVSIHNDFEGSDISLGYDTAINSIVDMILKIKDTIDSLKYPKPRLFGIQIPGNAPANMLEEVAYAVEGNFLKGGFKEKNINQLANCLLRTFAKGQTYSFLIFNEQVGLDAIKQQVLPAIDVDWKAIEIDEALCTGPNPSAFDRLLATKMAEQIIIWVQNSLQAGKLLVHSRKVIFQES